MQFTITAVNWEVVNILTIYQNILYLLSKIKKGKLFFLVICVEEDEICIDYNHLISSFYFLWSLQIGKKCNLHLVNISSNY